MSREATPPHKTIIGTVRQRFWDQPTELDLRLELICGLIDEVAEESERKYPGQRLDLVVLPEEVLTGGTTASPAEKALPLTGDALATMAAKARQHGTYLIVPLVLVEDKEESVYSNAAPLLDREGDVVGIYRKVHPVSYLGTEDLEEGIDPGRDFPVFDCDFGRLGIQICWDMSYRDGWAALAAKGAEVVAWPSAAAQTMLPRARAFENDYYIVSSTSGDNAGVFEPSGLTGAQVRAPGRVLVHRIDLSYMVLHWSSRLRGGRAFADLYGDRVGYHWSDTELSGTFWSNDPAISIGEMADRLGLRGHREEVTRSRRLQDSARGGPPR
jgi:predicted amidohydrolase